MNLRSLLFSALFAFVSATSNEVDEKTLILKAVVNNLPAACKQLNAIGSFDALSEKSYKCLFEDDFNVRKTSIIMTLLMQRGDSKLVQEISKKWVSKRNWGPFSQSDIVKDLLAVISVKRSVRCGQSKGPKVEIQPKFVYDAFKTLLKEGSGFIVANQIYSNVAAKVFNLAHLVDKNDKDFTATCSIILDHFYSIKDKKLTSAEDVDTVKLAQAYYVVQSLNRLAEKRKVDAKVWEAYGPFICSKLKSIYGIQFGMVERVAKKKNLKNAAGIDGAPSPNDSAKSNSSSSSSSTSSEEDEVVETIDDQGNKVIITRPKEKPTKFIELMNKDVSKIKALVTANASGNTIEFGSAGFWWVFGGSFLFFSLLGFATYNIMSKRRKASEPKIVEI